MTLINQNKWSKFTCEGTNNKPFQTHTKKQNQNMKNNNRPQISRSARESRMDETVVAMAMAMAMVVMMRMMMMMLITMATKR